jgi:hypothetical protein
MTPTGLLASPKYFKTSNENCYPSKPTMNFKNQKSFEVPALRFNPSSGTSLVDWSIGAVLSRVLKYQAKWAQGSSKDLKDLHFSQVQGGQRGLQ